MQHLPAFLVTDDHITSFRNSDTIREDGHLFSIVNKKDIYVTNIQ